MTERTCRACGCTDHAACVDPVLGPCWWVEEGLCSHCRMANEALVNVIRVARDLHSASVPVELRHAEQLQRMALWSMSQPVKVMVSQVRESVDALIARADGIAPD